MLRPTRRLWTVCDVSPLPPAGGVGGGPVAAIPTPLQLGPAAQTQVSLPSRKRAGLERNKMRYLPLTRSAERSVGKECVSTGRSRWSPEHKKTNKTRTKHKNKKQ